MQRGEAQSPEKIYFNLAMLALENKDFAAAEDNFRKAIEVCYEDFREDIYLLLVFESSLISVGYECGTFPLSEVSSPMD